MSDHAKTVLWLGLLMITFSIILRWGELRQLIFGSPSSQSSGRITTTNLKKGQIGGTYIPLLQQVGHGYHG